VILALGQRRLLADQGVELVRGDLEDVSSLEAAVRGVHGVYSVQDFWAVGAKREVAQGNNLADAAKRAGVEQFVYSSVGGAERNTGTDHWDSKWEIEKHIRQLGLPATVLRPVAFMEGYYGNRSRSESFRANSCIRSAPISHTRQLHRR